MSLQRGPGIITDGLVFYADAANPRSYISGSTTTDSLTDNSYKGTLTNGINFSADNQGVLDFDGVDDYISSSYTNIDIQPQDAFTCGAWIYHSKNNSIQFILSFEISLGVGAIPLYIWDTNKVRFGVADTRVSGGNAYVKESIDPLPLNEWYYVVCVKNPTPLGPPHLDGTMYWNGVEVSTRNAFNGAITSTTNGNLIIGKRGAVNTSFFGGDLSSLKLYNRALSADEVLQNYNALKGRFGL
jgi:hypothetical protein